MIMLDACNYARVSRWREFPGEEETWATIRAGAGTLAVAHADIDWTCAEAPLTDKFRYLDRTILVFDTSAVAGKILSAVLALTGPGVTYSYAAIPPAELGLFKATPANPNNIVASDYGQCGTVACSDDTILASAWLDGHNLFELNPTGLAYINAGKTSFCLRTLYDVLGVAPPWVDGKFLQYSIEPSRTATLYINGAELPSADKTLQEPIVLLQAMRQVEMQFGGQLSISKEGTYTYRSRQSYYEGV